MVFKVTIKIHDKHVEVVLTNVQQMDIKENNRNVFELEEDHSIIYYKLQMDLTVFYEDEKRYDLDIHFKEDLMVEVSN